MYESNPLNVNVDDLPFDGDEMLITRQQLYRINDNIMLRLNNDLIVEV